MPAAKKHRAPMRVRIFAYLALFCAFTIAVLWLFQTVFFDRFYQSIMLRKIEKAQDAIAGAWGARDSESFSARVFDVAGNSGFCVTVYRIENGRGEVEVKAHESPYCLVHNLQSPEQLASFYNGADAAGGAALFRFDEQTLTDSADGRTIVSARITPYDGGELMTLVNTNIFPVESTVSTLRIQLAAVTLILLLASALLAVVISRRLSRPVAAINDRAKVLATGDYSVRFDGGSYRESAELADTLNVAATELGKVDAMQKELIANISHDLRTPLTMISGYAEVMRDIPGEMTAENMQIILDETARLTSLVGDVLDLSRLTSGESDFHPATFSLTALAAETMKRYAKLTEREGYEITFAADREVFVHADETRVSQVIYNLVNNAISYTGDDKRVAVEQSVRGEAVRISVTDTGEGIPEDKLPLIWERYYRASEYHRRGSVGSGLGLAIVKNILDKTGAAYGVSSTVGEGSTFWFELPVAPPPASVSGDDASASQVAPHTVSADHGTGGSKPTAPQTDPLQTKGENDAE